MQEGPAAVTVLGSDRHHAAQLLFNVVHGVYDHLQPPACSIWLVSSENTHA